MASVVSEREQDGRIVLVYDNGMERWKDTGRIAKPAENTLLTGERATVLHRQRQEKAAAALRARILDAHNRGDMTPVNSSVAAFAESGALLYEEIVLNAESYARDRLEAWEKLGKYAQVLPADVRNVQADPNTALQAVTAAANAETARTLERLWRDVAAAQTIQPQEVIDIRSNEQDDGE